jgi:hypothetical protein
MERASHSPAPGELVAGLVLSVAVPLVGFAVGGLWLTRGGRAMVAAGAAASGLAVAALGFWLGFTFR